MKLQGRDLTKQMQGEDVSLLQDELRQLGYPITDEEAKGMVFGETTYVAVMDFQSKYGLRAMGQVDDETANQIGLALAALESQHGPLIVRGHIRQKDDSPCSALPVKAFDKNLRSEALLSQTITTDDGSYEITYTANQLLKPEKQSANLVVRAFDQDGSRLAESATIFNAGAIEVVDLFVVLPDGLHPSEYKRLATELRMQGVQPADLTDEDVAFLAGETGIDRQFIDLFRSSDALARLTNFPPEVTFALARQGLALNLDDLLSAPPDTLRQAIESAIEENIIPARTNELLDEVMQRIEQLRKERERRQQKTVVQQVAGRLLDQNTQLPLVGFTVRAFDLDTDPGPKSLGYSITNGQGYFSLVYTVTHPAPLQDESEDEHTPRLGLHILDRQAMEIYEVEVSPSEDQQYLVIRVPVPAVPQPPSPTLDELATALAQGLPEGLQPFLAARGITTLADVRTAGGIHHLEGLPVTANHPAVLALEAHANLSILSQDVACNALLIERGYTSIRKIAQAPESQFVRVVRDQVGDFKGAQMYVQARAQMHLFDNVLTRVRADKANGLSNPLEHQLPALGALDSCDCQACQAAVSTAAYLLDLIDFTIQKLTYLSQPVDLAWLTAQFHQPFADLVVSCDAVETLVHQVRICIEVLRSYLPTGSEFPGESDYRREAYVVLLSKIGTSYEEIRLARTMTADKRKALADRLSISLGTENPDRIGQLFFDLTKPQTLTERTLEDLFGLVDTTRNPLVAGTPSKFLSWRLEYLRTLWHDQDRPPLPNAGLPIVDPDVIGPGDLLNPTAGNPAFDLWQARRNAVDSILNQLALDYQAQGFTFILQEALANPLPDLNALRDALNHGTNLDQTKATITNSLHLTIESFTRLMAIKEKVDGNQPLSPGELQELFAILAEAEKVKLFPNWIADEQTKYLTIGPERFWIALKEPDLVPWLATTEVRQAWQQALRIRSQPPIIDPDLLSELDFKNPKAEDPAYTIWQNRGNEINQVLTNWENQVRNQPGNIDALIASGFGPPSSLVDLATQRANGQDISARLDQLSIDLDAFLRLLDLRTLIQSNAPVLDDEWQEFYAILLQTWKRRQFASWRDEEERQNILLSPDSFVIPAPSLLPLVPQPTLRLLKWRATVLARNEWQDTLQSRIDQQQALQDGLNAVIDTCEEETLPILRDALLLQVDLVTQDLESKAKWFTSRLLIDAQVNGCQKTTRIAQAIETIQILLFSIRTGQFKDSIMAQGLVPAVAGLVFAPPLQGPPPTPNRTRLDLFVLGTDHTLWHAFYHYPNRSFPNMVAWSDWTSSGGQWTSGPAAAWNSSIVDGGLHVFARGSDNAIWQRRWSNDQWVDDWTSLGGQWTSAPAAVSDGWEMHVFARGMDNAIYQNKLRSGGGWQSLGGQWASAPAAAQYQGGLGLFVRGMDNAIYQKQWADGSWQPLGGQPPLGVQWNSAPAAAVLEQTQDLYVFVRGTDSALYYTLWSKGQWQGDWKPLGGEWISDPAAASQQWESIGVFVQGNDDSLWVKGFANPLNSPTTIESPWESLPSSLAIVDDNFDEEWQWIGSYATWRAAIFIFLYPENVLIPSLRKVERQTSAFRNFVAELRPNRRLTPEQACEAASTYADYFRDVSNLKIEASCTALTHIHTGDCRNKTIAQQDKFLFYVFARGASNTVYWSTYDPQDPSGYGQTFWDVIPGLDQALQIVGAVPYFPRNDQHSILLFVKTLDKGEQKFKMTVFDLFAQRWSGDLIELDPPQKGTDFSVVVQQQDEVGDPDGIPLVVFCLTAAPGTIINGKDVSGQQAFYARHVNKAGTGWEDADFAPLWSDPTSIKVLALVKGPIATLGWWYMLFIEGWSGLTVVKFPADSPVGDPPLTIDKQSLVGAFLYPSTTSFPASQVFIIVRDPTTGIVSYGRRAMGGRGPLTFDQSGLSDIERIAPHCGVDPTHNGRMLAYQGFQSKPGTYQSIFMQNDLPSDLLTQSTPVLIAPIDSGPFDITEHLSEKDLQFKAKSIRQAYLDTLADPPSNGVYLDEAYYFVPMFLALQLQQAGQYIAALDWFRTIYDYATPDGQRNIWYGFELEKSQSYDYQRKNDWLLDPLNPHQIAATRAGTYLRFTLLALVRCFLDYADAEFTRDTAESIPRARRLYMTVLELLGLKELNLKFGVCSTIIGELDIPLGGEWAPAIFALRQALASIPSITVLKTVVTQVQEVLHGYDSVEARFAKANLIVREAQEISSPPSTVVQVLEQRSKIANRADMELLALNEITEPLQRIGNVVGQDFLQSVSSVAGINQEQLMGERVDLPWLAPALTYSTESSNRGAQTATVLAHRTTSGGETFLNGNGTFLSLLNPVTPTYNAVRAAMVQSMPLMEVNRLQRYGEVFVPGPAIGFCIPQNPILLSLRLHAELNLFKLRNCRNIAGDVRTLEPYVAPTDTSTGLPEIGSGQSLILPGVDTPAPTPYRYTVLIERAKQLVSSAQQIEAAFLSALEKRDAEYYTLLKARQDISLAKANVHLQDLRVTEAESGVTLAQLQQERAQLQVDHYQQMLDEGISGLELASLDLLQEAATFQGLAALANFIAAALPSQTGVGFSYSPQGTANSIASGISSIAGSLSTTASVLSTLASYERRAEEWEFQKSLAQQDVRIGGQQVKIAQDHVRVVGQEQKIAQLQADHAEAVAEFLGNKFTSYELYDWMSVVLEGVYNYILQQATATAQLALNQLAFERQQPPPPLIRADYWQPPSENGQSVDGLAPDRRGITGSARLLQDITQLDQYRFDTDRRKLQMVKTISLVNLAPEAFVRFQETGVLSFETPMELFDREFPGHYLRLIRRVRVSVVALIPPISGIRATLTSDRVSRVVIGGDIFQTVKIQHGPDYVALSSAREATGLFELDVQSEMLLPFEGIGVATTWEFRMPKAANLFDYRTIADVLFTLEYTALNDFTYGQQVIQSLNPNLSANRPFSFSSQFADAWYDLHNPTQSATPMTVQFTTIREDFPPNLENLKIQHVALYFVRKEGSTVEVDNLQLHFTPKGGKVPVGGTVNSIDGIISTRKGNGSSWASMIGLSPIGDWELALSDDQTTKDLFKNEEIEDILFVITYSGRTPAWPV